MTETTAPTAELIAARYIVRANVEGARKSVAHFAGRVAANPADAAQRRNLGDAVEALRRRADQLTEVEAALLDAGYPNVTIAPAQDIACVWINRDIDAKVLDVSWTGDDGWHYKAAARVDGDFEVTRYGDICDRSQWTFCGRVPEAEVLTMVASGRAMGFIRQAGAD